MLKKTIESWVDSLARYGIQVLWMVTVVVLFLMIISPTPSLMEFAYKTCVILPWFAMHILATDRSNSNNEQSAPLSVTPWIAAQLTSLLTIMVGASTWFAATALVRSDPEMQIIKEHVLNTLQQDSQYSLLFTSLSNASLRMEQIFVLSGMALLIAFIGMNLLTHRMRKRGVAFHQFGIAVLFGFGAFIAVDLLLDITLTPISTWLLQVFDANAFLYVLSTIESLMQFMGAAYIAYLLSRENSTCSPQEENSICLGVLSAIVAHVVSSAFLDVSTLHFFELLKGVANVL